MPIALPNSQNMQSALFMVIAMAGYSFNDAFAKLANENIGLFQIVFLRGIFIFLFLSIVLYYSTPAIKKHEIYFFIKHPCMIIRIIGELGATVFFLAALFNMPIANVTAIIQLVPLLITAGAAIFFKEKIGIYRLLAVLCGFIGVLFIVRPGSEQFNLFAIYALLAVFSITIRDMATHRLPKQTPSIFVSFITCIAVTSMGGVSVAFTTWQTVDLHSLFYILLAAIMLTFGYIFSVLTMRVGEISFSSPFRYSIMVWALLTGYLIWREIPNFYETIGGLLIIGGGILAYYRERSRSLTTNHQQKRN